MSYVEPPPPNWIVLRSSDIYRLPPSIDGIWWDVAVGTTELHATAQDGALIVLKPVGELETDVLGQVAEVYRPHHIVHPPGVVPGR